MVDAIAQLKELVTPEATVDQIAEKCGRTKRAVYSWISGEARPEFEVMELLELHFGIPISAWKQRPTGELERHG